MVRSQPDNVLVSSVCPRIKSDTVSTQIQDVKAGFQVMCGEENVSFVDSNFLHLADSTVNDRYYLKDGVHLNYKATERLVRNLGLKLKDGIDSACIPPKRSQPRQAATTAPATTAIADEDDAVDTRQAFWSTARRKAAGPKRNGTDRLPQPTTTTQRQNQSPPTDAHCYNCYETNHTSRTCRHERPITCHQCGFEGHKAKHHDGH